MVVMAPQTSSSVWAGRARIRGFNQLIKMAVLTFSLVGLQFTWAVEMTYFEPHLLKLGLAKSQTSLVWIAPPLSGLIIQPIVGVWSDSSRSRWGRRRPFMLFFSALVAFVLAVLAWAEGIVRCFADSEVVVRRATVTLAVVCIYAVDFAINGVQASCRSLIVDTLPESQQQLGSAWAGRMLGLGHVLGYLVGTIDLSSFLGSSLGGTQFKQICVIAGAAIVFSNSITCFCVEERVLMEQRRRRGKMGGVAMLSTILKTIMHLPRKIRTVCWITFWSWFGWSPFFVYGTTWVGETYYRQNADNAAALQTTKDAVGEIARKGSLALVLFSVISFTSSIVLPFLIALPSDEVAHHPTRTSSRQQTAASSLFQRYQIDITTAWGISQLAFAASMILAPFSTSFQFATTLIALCGASWAMYGWAPLAIMGEEINRLSLSSSPSLSMHRSSTSTDDTTLQMSLMDHDPLSSTTTMPDEDPSSSSSSTITNLKPHQRPRSDADDDDGVTAGIYLAIHNIFATIPQFLATFVSMVVFSILEPGQSPELASAGADSGGGNDKVGEESRISMNGLSGTAVCLAIGAVFQLVAAAQSLRMRRWG